MITNRIESITYKQVPINGKHFYQPGDLYKEYHEADEKSQDCDEHVGSEVPVQGQQQITSSSEFCTTRTSCANKGDQRAYLKCKKKHIMLTIVIYRIEFRQDIPTGVTYKTTVN